MENLGGAFFSFTRFVGLTMQKGWKVQAKKETNAEKHDTEQNAMSKMQTSPLDSVPRMGSLNLTGYYLKGIDACFKCLSNTQSQRNLHTNRISL